MPYRDPKDPRKLLNVNAWTAANPEKVKAAKKKYAANNKEAIRERIKKWQEANPGKMNAARKAWAERNKHRGAAAVRKRQAALIQRTPKWLDADELWLMQEVYDLARLRTNFFGFRWDVDHVLPLRGKTVSGLHVLRNLQVIPSVENYKKGNRV